MDELIIRLRRIGSLLLLGLLALICVAIGVYYMQVNARQNQLTEEMASITNTLSRPLASAEQLQKEYQDITKALTPMAVKDILDIIVSIARASGIDVDPKKDKLRIPPQDQISEEKIGDAKYRVISFNDITAQGTYASVMAFTANLESSEKLKTLVLKKAIMGYIDVPVETEEKPKTEGQTQPQTEPKDGAAKPPTEPVEKFKTETVISLFISVYSKN